MNETSLRMRVEVIRIDPITVNNDHLFLLCDADVIWEGHANDASLSNLLPHFASHVVINQTVPLAGVELTLMLVNDKSRKQAKVAAVRNAIGQVLGGAAGAGLPVVSAPAGVIQGVLQVVDVLRKSEPFLVLGGVFIKAVPNEGGLDVMMSTTNEKFPLLRLDADDELIIDNTLNWERATMSDGAELRLMTACHEGGRCRAHLYLRVGVSA